MFIRILFIVLNFINDMEKNYKKYTYTSLLKCAKACAMKTIVSLLKFNFWHQNCTLCRLLELICTP